MFDNLLGQDSVRDSLSRELREDRLPPSLLFSGPAASGKLTAALETARVLSCTAEGSGLGAWGCPCPACARHRVLSHSDLLLLGSRSFPEEIPMALEMLSRAPGRASAHFFVRAVAKLARRFDRPLWEGEEGKLAKAAPLLRDLEESMSVMDPGGVADGSFAEETLKEAESAARICARLEPVLPDAPPVFMVRNMELWSRLAPSGKRKTVVIENADRMLDSARNAMLKLLEEPPDSVRFVLITSRRAAVMATILSRSRTYPFETRSGKAVAEVMRRVFRSEEPVRGLSAYLESKSAFSPGEALDLARRFSAALRSGEPYGPILDELASRTQDFGAKDERFSDSFPRFLRACLDLSGEMLRDPASGLGELALADRWSRLAREASLQYGSYNRNPDLLLRVLAGNFGGTA